jgi:hypothetical protein
MGEDSDEEEGDSDFVAGASGSSDGASLSQHHTALSQHYTASHLSDEDDSDMSGAAEEAPTDEVSLASRLLPCQPLALSTSCPVLLLLCPSLGGHLDATHVSRNHTRCTHSH